MIATLQALSEDNRRCIAQGTAVLAMLDDAAYRDRGPAGVALGPHFRHIFDHYQALFVGLEGGVVDYEDRRRDRRVEEDRGLALAVAEDIGAALAGLPGRPLPPTIQVACHSGPEARVRHAPLVSCPARELLFVMLHSVHHLAMVAGELRRRGLDCDPDLGLAPATLGARLRP